MTRAPCSTLPPYRPPFRGRPLVALAAAVLAAASMGVPPVAAAEDAPCPSVVVAGVRSPPRPAMSGVVATAQVESLPDLAYAQDSAIFPAPTVQTIPTLVQGGSVQVVLSLDVVSYSALEVTWAFSRISGISPLDSRLARCELLPGASGSLPVPEPPRIGIAPVPGHIQVLATYVFQGPFAGLHLNVTEQGAGTVAWSVAVIPLATVCPELVDPSCPHQPAPESGDIRLVSRSVQLSAVDSTDSIPPP